MWFGIIIGGGALLGMAALLLLKTRELSGGDAALLQVLRRADPYVENVWRNMEVQMPMHFEELCRTGYGFCRERIHVLGVATHARLHQTSVRFGEYLKKQGVAVSKNPENASGYIQDMLEYKRTVSGEQDVPKND